MSSNPPDLQAVLWDYGGVFTPSPFHALDAYASQLGISAVRLVDIVLGYALPDGGHPWHRLERGEVALSEAVEEIRRLAAEAGLGSFSIRDFFGTMRPDDAGVSRDEVFDAVRRLREAGVVNVIVSNNVAEFAEHWMAVLPDGLFDDVIDSSAVGVRKPDPAIFRLALERAGAPAPHRVAFFDDHQGNVDGAAALGIRARLVGAEPMDAVSALLRELGLD